MMQERSDERSLGELFGDLAKETSELVRQEVQLARTEMTQKVSAVESRHGVLPFWAKDIAAKPSPRAAVSLL